MARRLHRYQRNHDDWFRAFKTRRQRQRTVMEFKLNHDYTVRDADKQGDPLLTDNRKITEFLIRTAINARYPQGSKERVVQRQIARVQKALAETIKTDKTSLDLTEDSVRFILDSLREHSCHPHHASWFIDLLDYCEPLIEGLKKGPAPSA